MSLSTTEPSFIAGKRKYLFCADQKGMAKLASIIEKVVESNIPFELVFIGAELKHTSAKTDISGWLSGQKMGTFLYVAVSWDRLKGIKKLAEQIGYSSEESQYIGYGPQPIQIFCCRCHGITEVLRELEAIEQMVTKCNDCGLLVEVSNHYSTIRDAYLGYVAKL